MAADQNNNERTVVQLRDPLLGGVFDRRFRIEARIAAGGFGAIYRATHLKSGHQFALKVLHPNLTSAPDVVARFRREGAALTLLRDPHTITAYELGETDDGTLYIVMELLRGESLYERYRANGPMEWPRVVAIARAVCSSLAEAHALGIIHRDLKPTNIHLEPRGNERDFVKVLDFGIAKILQDSDIDSSDLTQAGQMIGTLDYMSPEQMVGGMCDASSDIYTLGIVMYEMIAGGKPYDNANSAAAALAAVLTMTPPRLSTRAIVTPELDQVVMRCLERQHTERYQTAIELATALDEILPGLDEVVTRVAVGSTTVMPGVPPGMSGFASTLPGVANALPGIPKTTTRSPTWMPVAPKAETPAPKMETPAPKMEAPAPKMETPGPKMEPSISKTEPTAPKMEPSISKTEPAAMPIEPPESTADLAEANTELAEANTELAEATDPTAAATTEPMIPRLKPPAKPVTTEPMIPRLTPPAKPAPVARPSPVPKPAPLDLDSTLVGTLAPEHAAPAARSLRSGTPLAGTPHLGTKNLRDAYPTIHRPPPSPLRPPLPPFDDRPASPTGNIAPFDMERTVRRDAMFRRLALAIGIAIAVIAALVIASRL